MISTGRNEDQTVKNWILKATSVATTNTVMCASKDLQYIFIAPQSTNLYRSTNTGQSFSTTTTSALNWSGIACSRDGKNVIAAVNGGNLYYSNNYGTNFTSAASAKNWVSVACSSNGNVAVASTSGAGTDSVWVSLDAGITWSSNTNSSGDGTWVAVDCNYDGSVIAAANYAGPILLSSDYGKTWVTGAATDTWNDLKMDYSGKNIYATNASTNYYTFSNAGSTFNKLSMPIAMQNIACSKIEKTTFGVAASGDIAVSYNGLNVNTIKQSTGTTRGGICVSETGGRAIYMQSNGSIYANF